jgi:hypothetical protein
MSNGNNNDNNKSLELQKKKKFKELLRKIVINFFVWLVIITFVISLGTYYWNKQNVNVVRVAQINGKVYTYQPGSLFYHLMSLVRDNITKNDKNTDAESMNVLAVESSIEFLTNYAIAHDFSKKVGVVAAPDILKNILEYRLKGRLASAPDKGLVEFSEFEYANYAISGDFNNVLAVIPPTSGELYSFLDLANFTADADVLYMDISNYIIGKIKDSDVEKFYEDRVGKYASEVFVDELSVKSKSLAYEILRSALTNGWDKAVEDYKSKASRIDGLLLKRTSGLMKRFDLAVSVKKGEVAPKVQFENAEYHILKVNGYPPLSSREGVNREMVKSDYVGLNFDALRKQYDGELQGVLKQAIDLANGGGSFGTIASTTGFTYKRAVKTTPVSDHLKDYQGTNLPVQYIKNPEWMDFLFTAKKGQVSKIYTDENQVVILKVIDSGINKKFSIQDINKDILEQYLRFKSVASFMDWSKNMKDQYTVTVFKDDLTNLTKPKDQ